MSKNKKKMGPLETPAFPPGRSRIAIGWDVPCPHPRVAPNGPSLTPKTVDLEIQTAKNIKKAMESVILIYFDI
jgi:hypothetical protein